MVQGQIVAQPLGSHHHGEFVSSVTGFSNSFRSCFFFPRDRVAGSNAGGRPSLMELSYLPPRAFIVTNAAAASRSDAVGTDYSRPPPPGSTLQPAGPSPVPANVSCYNCGGSGHYGFQCTQVSVEEIIRPSPAC